jgi:hypothetical protein
MTGTVNWTRAMDIISKSPYNGCLTLETEYRGNENIEQLENFLKTSYQSGIDLASI